jgi:hypothetical protein
MACAYMICIPCSQVPFLLKLPLREYQHIGMDWLVTMYKKRLNGILADEVGRACWFVCVYVCVCMHGTRCVHVRVCVFM